MNKIIKLLIISLLFISPNLKPQAITSPPEQGLTADFNLYDYESSLFYSKNAQGFTYKKDELKEYLDDEYIQLLTEIFQKKIKPHPKCIIHDDCDVPKLMWLSRLVGIGYKAKYKEQPVYPSSALEFGYWGEVIVSFDILENGKVDNVKKVSSVCFNEQGNRFEDCKRFDNSTLAAAKKLEYYPLVINGEPIRVNNVPHKFTYEIDLEGRAFADYPSRILRKIDQFTRKQQWVLLEDYARDLHGRYELKYYWIGEAQFHKQNYAGAKTNFKQLLSFDSVPWEIKNSARERLLQITYAENSFATNQNLCEFTGSSVKNYLCGINFLTIGDSLSAIYFFIEALKERPNENIKSRIENLIESQRIYLKDDLSKLN